MGQPFVVSQTVQPGIFWRRTCKCLGFSSYSLVYATVCTTYNQGMPNRCIFFYLYQIGFYYCETILSSSYIQTFFYSHLPKSLSCVYPEQLDIVQLSGKVLPWGQFSSQPLYGFSFRRFLSEVKSLTALGNKTIEINTRIKQLETSKFPLRKKTLENTNSFDNEQYSNQLHFCIFPQLHRSFCHLIYSGKGTRTTSVFSFSTSNDTRK